MDTLPPAYRRLGIGAALVILGLGVFFRVTHLSTKVYWNDEVYTSLWLSGFDPSHSTYELFDGRELSASELLRYQRIHPNRGLTRTVRTLARNDPHHPPLYYTMAWVCARWFLDSTTAIRALSALFGLLVLPATFWLCMEALGDRRAAWLGTLLVAVSPVHVLYSQEAREYSLWALMTILSTAALLRAQGSTRGREWVLYGVCTLLGLYTHGLYPLVMFAHGAWIVALAVGLERNGDTAGRRLVARYLAANVVPLALFAPWALNTVRRMGQVGEYTDWMRKSSKWGSLVELWGTNFASVFVDGNVNPDGIGAVLLTILRVAALVIGVGGLVVSWRYPQRRVWLLAAALVALPLLVIATPDILWGGQRSTQARLLFPGYVGMILATVHFLMPWLTATNRKARLAGGLAVIFLLVVGVGTCSKIWSAPTWWNKGEGWDAGLNAVRTINESQSPLVLSGPILTRDDIGNTVGLGHLLDGHVRMRVLPDGELPTIAPDVTDVFFVNVTDEFVEKLAGHVRLKRLTPKGDFYRCLD